MKSNTIKQTLEKCGWTIREIKALSSLDPETASYVEKIFELPLSKIKATSPIDARKSAHLNQILSKVDKTKLKQLEEKKEKKKPKKEEKQKQEPAQQPVEVSTKPPPPSPLMEEFPWLISLPPEEEKTQVETVTIEEPIQQQKEKEEDYLVVRPSQQEKETVKKDATLAPARKRHKPFRRQKVKEKKIIEKPPVKQKVEVPVPISVRDFSTLTGIKIPLILKKLLDNKIVVNINSPLDEEKITLLGLEFDREFILRKQRTIEDELAVLEEEVEDLKKLKPRPPVVTIMGHVDHGKTTLLDKIRNTNVAQHEPGGITQRIGAYRVKVADKSITFIDTPGHEAFTKMRARGANVTDIVVLVVAANEGVMPQTIEALNHAKAARVPIIVAITKCDLPDVNTAPIKNHLAKLGLVPEEWGGDTIYHEVSGITGQNVQNLLESILLLAELHDLKSDPEAPAKGVVIEAKRSPERGPVATLIIRKGTLKKRDIIICGSTVGIIKAIFDENGRSINEAYPSTPVEVIGLSDVPEPGDKFYVVDNIEKAKAMAEIIAQRKREFYLAEKGAPARIPMPQVKEHNIIIKANTQGILEVLKDSIKTLEVDEVKIKIIHYGVGNVTETDVDLAKASNAIIVAFSTQPDPKADHIIKQSNIKVFYHNVIYQLLDELKALFEETLEPEKIEEIIGHCQVKKIFHIPKIGVICGSYVMDGKIERNSLVRVRRDTQVVFEGKVASLKRFANDVNEVTERLECGIKIENFEDAREGDIIEVYRLQLMPRKIYTAKT